MLRKEQYFLMMHSDNVSVSNDYLFYDIAVGQRICYCSNPKVFSELNMYMFPIFFVSTILLIYIFVPLVENFVSFVLKIFKHKGHKGLHKEHKVYGGMVQIQ